MSVKPSSDPQAQPEAKEDNRDPMIGARVPVDVRFKLQALQDHFPRPDGRSGTMSDVLRWLLGVALVVVDAPTITMLRVLAAREGISEAEAWRRLKGAGAKALGLVG